MKKTRTCFLVLLTVFLSACISHQQYRTDYRLCISAKPQQACSRHAIQNHQQTNGSASLSSYTLGFIEFDDQGQLWDRLQMRAVLDKLHTDAANNEQLIIVFVHGWKHSAAPGDSNITMFRKTLQRLSLMENHLSQKPRQVTGIYLGWRGGAVSLPGIQELTFWNRKNTAHKVGYGAVTEVLSRLELLRQTKHAIAQQTGHESTTRLVIVGHSFGGAVVYSALSEILEKGFVHTLGPDTVAGDTIGFGDLVVLLNPAFEAQRFATLSDMANERRSYFASQLPALAILTSETDYATKYAFPAGRWLSTLFENERTVSRKNPLSGQMQTIQQSRANITTVGHFNDYSTHFLRASAEPTNITAFNVKAETALFFDLSKSWEQDRPGSTIDFGGSLLTRNNTSVARNPYLNINVGSQLIPDHNSIYDPRIEQFIRQLILISSQSNNMQTRQQQRSGVVNAISR